MPSDLSDNSGICGRLRGGFVCRVRNPMATGLPSDASRSRPVAREKTGAGGWCSQLSRTQLKIQGMQNNNAEQTRIDGPHVVIDGVALEANRMTFSPMEVARVMRVPESEVRSMIRKGELQDVSCDGRRRLDPDEVIAAVERRVHDGKLEKHVFVELAALIAGRI
jgi:hypothetical protein